MLSVKSFCFILYWVFSFEVVAIVSLETTNAINNDIYGDYDVLDCIIFYDMRCNGPRHHLIYLLKSTEGLVLAFKCLFLCNITAASILLFYNVSVCMVTHFDVYPLCRESFH